MADIIMQQINIYHLQLDRLKSLEKLALEKERGLGSLEGVDLVQIRSQIREVEAKIQNAQKQLQERHGGFAPEKGISLAIHLFYPILFCSILFCSIHSVLFYSILLDSVLFCSILFYSILIYSNLICSILFRSVLFILFCLTPRPCAVRSLA
jgi:hypothetical protein